MAEFPAVDLREGGADVDLREDGSFEFRLVKQRFGATFLKLEVVGRARSWYLDNLLLEVANAGPGHAVEVGQKAGYRFLAGPEFSPAPRGQVVVWGRMAPAEAITIPEPATPVLP